ncbi:MAG: YebC/PmpR family DNA-binding transcriptional regulator [Patescibacteria group bacterium]
MSGHSKWKTIKHKKEATDQKRGKIFSKLLNAVAIAAKTEQNPEFNPRLRTAIQKAKENKVPQDNIDRAIKRSSESKDLGELIIEAYGPEGVAILIEAVTDSKNRAIAEIKKILSDHSAKFAESGSVQWVFEQNTNAHKDNTNATNEPARWTAKFKQEISDTAQRKLQALIEALEEHDDVQEAYTNT